MANKKGPGNIDHHRRGTELVHKHGHTHDRQPQGHAVHDSAPLTVKKGGYQRSDHHHDYFKRDK